MEFCSSIKDLTLIGLASLTIKNVIFDCSSSLKWFWQLSALSPVSPPATPMVESKASCPSITTRSQWPPSSPKSPSNHCPTRCKHVHMRTSSYLLIRSLQLAHNCRERISRFFFKCLLYHKNVNICSLKQKLCLWDRIIIWRLLLFYLSFLTVVLFI